MNRWLVATTVCIAASVSAQAASAAQLSTQLSANRVEVGQEFTLQLTCMVDSSGDAPSDPRLNVPRGISVRGPSQSTQQSVSIINGRMQQQSGLVATWVLSASAEGRYRIGPASIAVGGHRATDHSVEVEVVARGTLPHANRGRRRPGGFDPFDPFGGSDPFSGPMFPPGMNLFPSQPQQEEPNNYPPELNIERARDPLAFLDARVTSTRLVVGEQTTLRVFAYGKPGPFELSLTAEPSRNDFLSYQNERDAQLGSIHRIKIDQETWFARQLPISYALFPTKTGKLRIGELEATFAGAGLFGGNTYRNATRRSQTIEVIVEEPPLVGRPPGYRIGDVGDFRMSATVEPRKIKAAEAVSVQIEISGTGQLPQRLDPPEQNGVDWLEPTVTQQIDDHRERIAGRRQFTYVVRLDRPGTAHLGRFRFAYFNPTSRKYAVASADLGDVLVESTAAANAPNAPTVEANADPFLSALHARGKLRNSGERSVYLAEKPSFFAWLLAGPALTLAAFGTRAGLSRLGQWRKSVRGSVRALLDAEQDVAQRALAASDPVLAASAVERYVHLLIEHAAGLRGRGILRSELAREIALRGIAAALAESAVALLERCDHVRFVQPNLDEARNLVQDATNLALALQPQLRQKARRPS